jgi:hypothetical protein
VNVEHILLLKECGESDHQLEVTKSSHVMDGIVARDSAKNRYPTSSLFLSKDEPEGSEGSAKRVPSFRDLNLIHASSRGGGNVGIGTIDFQGLW